MTAVEVYPRSRGGTSFNLWYRPDADRLQVYPRSRGGTTRSARRSTPACGLSPLARGNRSERSVCDVSPKVYPRSRGGTVLSLLVGTAYGYRSIPARAGEPGFPLGRELGRILYPRSRGGTRGISGSGREKEGLSPLARGNRGCARGTAPCSRSIPARAGEPSKGKVD